VDGEGRLVGVVPTRRLLLSPLGTPLGAIMVRRVVGLPAEATVLDACEFFIQHRLLALPVLDQDRRLLGLVDVELYTDELVRLGEGEPHVERAKYDDLFALIGVHMAQARTVTAVDAFRLRFPWLLCNIVGGILAALLISRYSDVLSWREAVLALFIPVVLALAESVSIQSVSLTLQTLQGQRLRGRTLLALVGRELLTGLLLGAGAGLFVAVVVLLWLRQSQVALCGLFGIVGGVTCAAILGLAIPYLLRLWRRDPQVAAGPIALVLADLLTLLIYFNLGRWLL
jgi:magnesium transporter